MVSYVLGFLFSSNHRQVLLVQKTKGCLSGTDKTQAGRVNGIGGHIEPGETPEQAMVREFQEETGTEIRGWVRFGRLHGKSFEIFLFRNAAPHAALYAAKAMTPADIPIVFQLDEVEADERVIPNLRWLIPMALSFGRGEHAEWFDIQEG